jgi:hypothetical protein
MCLRQALTFHPETLYDAPLASSGWLPTRHCSVTNRPGPTLAIPSQAVESVGFPQHWQQANAIEGFVVAVAVSLVAH